MTAHRPGFPRQSHGPEAHGAKASRTDARRPQSEGQKK